MGTKLLDLYRAHSGREEILDEAAKEFLEVTKFARRFFGQPVPGFDYEMGAGITLQVYVGAVLNERIYRAFEWLQSLDRRETSGLLRIRLTDERCADSASLYLHRPRDRTGEIVICRSGYRAFLDNLAHEVGHHVFSKMGHVPLSSNPKETLADAYGEYWRRNRRRCPFGDMPSLYACANGSEGFAESYRCLRLGKRLAREHKDLIAALIDKLPEACLKAAQQQSMVRSSIIERERPVPFWP